MRNLKDAMLLVIANEGSLPAEWRDHALTGDWADHRECHIGGDFLLIYRLDDAGSEPPIIFVRAGIHFPEGGPLSTRQAVRFARRCTPCVVIVVDSRQNYLAKLRT